MGNREDARERLCNRLEAVGGKWRIVRGSSKLWITQGRASQADYEQIKREMHAAGIAYYEYQDDE